MPDNMIGKATVRKFAKLKCVATAVAYLCLCCLAANLLAVRPAYADEPTSYICDTNAEDKPRVLIGKILPFGDIEPPFRKVLGPTISGTLVTKLASAGQISVSVLGEEGSTEARQFAASTYNVLSSAFTGGTPEGRDKDKLIDLLRTNKCDYLFGGHIRKDGELTTIIPFLVDERNEAALRPFPSITLDNYSSAPKVAELLSDELTKYISKTRGELPKPTAIVIACPKMVAGAPKEIAAIITPPSVIQKTVAEDLAAEKKFAIRVVNCPNDSQSAFPDADAIVVSSIKVLKNRVELAPSIKMLEKSAQEGQGFYSIELGALAEDSTSVLTLPADAAKIIREFFQATTTEAGAFPQIADKKFREQDFDLSSWKDAIRNRGLEIAALAAYNKLSREPESSAALYILGKVFLSKGEYDAALRRFLKATQKRNDLSSDYEADLDELIGATYAGMKEAASSLKYLNEARNLYEAQGKDEDARRVLRLRSYVLFTSGDQKGAITAFQGLNIENDVASMRFLGRLLFASGDYDEALKWLGKALNASPNDHETKYVLADIHSYLGQKYYNQKRYAEARKEYKESLSNKDSAQAAYGAGLSAWAMDDFVGAANEFANVIKIARTEHALTTWSEAAWLGLLECYLLNGDYSDFEYKAREAASVLQHSQDSLLVVNYLWFLTKIYGSPETPADDLSRDPTFKELRNNSIRGSAKESLSSWTSEKIDAWLKKQPDLGEEKSRLLNEARRALE